MSYEATRLLIVDDHTLFRAGVRMLLQTMPGIEVAGEAASGEEALDLLHRKPVDLVLLDLALPGMSGVTTAQRLRQKHPSTQLIVLSMYKEEEYVASALKAGASGYVLKEASQDELRMAIEAVRRGQTFISPAVAHLLLGPFLQASGAEDPLTPRQKQVLTLLARGLSAKEVAARLHLSTKTVETHRALLMERLGLRNLPALVLYAVRHGLIRPE